MAGGVYQIKHILLTLVWIIYLYSVAFYSNALLSFEIHIIQHLSLHIPLANGIGALYKPIGKGTFTMIYMGYNAKISNILHATLQTYF